MFFGGLENSLNFNCQLKGKSLGEDHFFASTRFATHFATRFATHFATRFATHFARMAVLSTLAITVLAGACIGLAVWYFFVTKGNYKAAIAQQLKPFSATVDPSTGLAGSFTTPSGASQISCPVGTSINIVGAFFDISDAFGECTTNPSGLVGYLCNPSYQSPTKCTTADDCPGPSGSMNCTSAGYCQLAPNPSSCTSSPSSPNVNYGYTTIGGVQYCVPTDVCGPGIPNPICSPGAANATNQYQCATRDATAKVSSKCNGRGDCFDLQMSDFGDYPCPGLAPTQCLGNYGPNGEAVWTSQRTGYCGLPFNPGWQGGPPVGSTPQGSGALPSSSLGYTMHGIYACV